LVLGSDCGKQIPANIRNRTGAVNFMVDFTVMNFSFLMGAYGLKLNTAGFLPEHHFRSDWRCPKAAYLSAPKRPSIVSGHASNHPSAQSGGFRLGATQSGLNGSIGVGVAIGFGIAAASRIPISTATPIPTPTPFGLPVAVLIVIG
jgi:hypothetical protein